MSFRFLFFWACLIPLAGSATSRVSAQLIEEPNPLFRSDHASEITLRFTEEEWSKLQPSKDIDWDVGRAFGEVISDASQGKEFRAGKESRPGLGGDAAAFDEVLRQQAVRAVQTRPRAAASATAAIAESAQNRLSVAREEAEMAAARQSPRLPAQRLRVRRARPQAPPRRCTST